MSKRKIFAITFLTILSLLVFSACSSEDTSDINVDGHTEVSEAENIESTEQEESYVDDEKENKEEKPEDQPEEVKESEEDIKSDEDDKFEEESSKDVKTEENEDEAVTAPNSTETFIVEDTTVEDGEEGPVLEISGSGVETSIKFSLNEMKAMTDYYFEDDYFSLNSYGTTEYFSFKGVRMKGLLEKAKTKENVKIVSFVASDGYEIQLTIEQVLREDYIYEQDVSKKYPVIIAWHENGKDYDIEKGLPFRLVIGQKEAGDVNKPQWVQNIAKIIVD